jgi:uncharacterized protein YqgC (DUF456 family)
MESVDVVAGLVVLVGLVGVVVPVLPGGLLIGLALLGWAVAVGTGQAWLVAVVGCTVLLVGAVVKYAVPGRRMQRQGVPGRTLAAGAVLGVVGFFVIPVIGLPIGFVAGIYLSELQRLGPDRAWPATKVALRAVGLAVLIELTAAVLAALVFVVGATTT